MISVLISLACAALVIWLIFYVLGQAGLPEVPRRIIAAVLAVIIIVWLLGYIGPVPGFYRLN